MKTANVLICIAIVASMTIPAKAGYGFIIPDDGGDDLFVHHSEIRTEASSSTSNVEGGTYCLIDCYADANGDVWELWYLWEHDCAFWICIIEFDTDSEESWATSSLDWDSWIGPAPMRPYISLTSSEALEAISDNVYSWKVDEADDLWYWKVDE